MDQKNADSGRLIGLAAIGIVCALALFGIVEVLGSGVEAQATTSKLTFTALALIGLNLVGATGVVLARRRPWLAPFGYVTLALAVIAFLAILKAVWDDGLLGSDGELQGITIAIALAAGQISLLLIWHDPEEDSPQRLVTLGTVLAIGVLALLAVIDVAKNGPNVDPKLFGAFAVLYLLGMALLPLLDLRAGRIKLSGAARSASLELDHVVIAVSDRAAAINFYTVLLGAEVVSLGDDRIAFRVGDRQLNVHDVQGTAAPVAHDPVRPGNSDLCFVWPASAESALALIRELGQEPVAGPVARIGARGPGRSVYCRDPDGSLIELISYG